MLPAGGSLQNHVYRVAHQFVVVRFLPAAFDQLETNQQVFRLQLHLLPQQIHIAALFMVPLLTHLHVPVVVQDHFAQRGQLCTRRKFPALVDCPPVPDACGHAQQAHRQKV